MTTTTKPMVGQSGAYIDAKGHEKAAIVFATPESLKYDEDVPEEDRAEIPENHVVIVLFGMTGVQYGRVVPLREAIEDIPDFTIDGELRGYFTLR